VVHLWRFDPREAPGERHLATLADSERTRAAEFRNAVARARFVLCRSTLRQILSSYLDLAPSNVPIETNAHGKPQLAAPHTLAFNMTHCDDLGFIAVAAYGALGVDVERLREMPRAMALAKRYFSIEEQQYLAQVPPAELSEGYLRLWTRKEACVKAWGIGIGANLGRFNACDTNSTVASPDDDHGELHVKTLQLKREHVAAVALDRDFSLVDHGPGV
jgi:4'-phosphopantetheinyl transferase